MDNDTDSNIQDQFDYISTNDIDTEFYIYMVEGLSFHKIIDYFKASEAVITLTAKTMTYSELFISYQAKKAKKVSVDQLDINMFCEFDVSKFKKYHFKSTKDKYEIFINIKSFADKIKKLGKNESLILQKNAGEDKIYVSSQLNSSDITFITPLVMKECKIFNHSETDKNDETNCCFVNTKKLNKDASKITTTAFKNVKIEGYPNKMKIHAISPYQTDGFVFLYEKPFSLGNVQIDLNAMKDLKIDKQKIDEVIFDITIPTNLLKNLAKLAKFSTEDFKVYFEKDTYMKIISKIKDYAIVYTYIKNSINS